MNEQGKGIRPQCMQCGMWTILATERGGWHHTRQPHEFWCPQNPMTLAIDRVACAVEEMRMDIGNLSMNMRAR